MNRLVPAVLGGARRQDAPDSLLDQTASCLKISDYGHVVPPANPDSVLIFLFDDEPLVKPEKVSRYFVSSWKSERARRADKEKRK